MQLEWYARGSEPLVYALGKRGAEILEAEGVARRGGVRYDPKNRNLSRMFLGHTLAVAEAMVAFEIACRGREGVRFIPPEEVLAGAPPETRRLRLPFRWQVEVRQGGKSHRLGVEPDKVFGLEFHRAPENRRRAYFFLEADRGTMPVMRKGLGQTSILRKLLAYRETWMQDLHENYLAIPNFRVLIATTNTERVKRFVDVCHSLSGGGSRLFLFADRESLGRGDILAHEWVNGRGEIAQLSMSTSASVPQRGV
jgi:hypothetical protein